MRSRRYSGFGEPPKKHKKKDLRGILLTLVLFLAVIAVIAGIIFFAKKFIPSSLLPSFGKKDAGESTETAEEVTAEDPEIEEIRKPRKRSFRPRRTCDRGWKRSRL